MAVAAGSTDSPVYLVMGVCGTGKTTIAHELASRLGLAVHDVCHKGLEPQTGRLAPKQVCYSRLSGLAVDRPTTSTRLPSA